MIDTDSIVKIDQCHLDLIYGILVSHKPKKVLELGMGSGTVTDIILKAFEYNGIPLDLICVDNWYDWGFKKPDEILEYEKRGVVVITSAERDFVFSCKEKYDFIISDADHYHANEWFKRSLSLLRPGGIIIYHDVANPTFPNLNEIYYMAKSGNLTHLLFCNSSRTEERCERGLLIISNDGDYRKFLMAVVITKFKIMKFVHYIRHLGQAFRKKLFGKFL